MKLDDRKVGEMEDIHGYPALNTFTGTTKGIGFPLSIDYVDVIPPHFCPHVLAKGEFDPTEHRFSPRDSQTGSVGVPL